MKRFTYKDASGNWVVACNRFWNYLKLKSPAHVKGEAVDRLAAYEETGLEPEDILSATDMAKVACALHELNQYKELGDLDRMRELCEAERDGRCYIATVKIGEQVFLPNEKGEIIGCRVQGISVPAHGKNLIIHLGGYPAEYLWSDTEGIDWWRSREAAETALKGEQDG